MAAVASVAGLAGVPVAVGCDAMPNIVVILADDLGIGTVGCYGSDTFKTPNVDALAAGGIRFTTCYSAPNCGPSRALMMTGRYGFRTGMTGNDKLAVAHLEAGHTSEVMIPTLLRTRGYATASAGKWNQVPLQPSDWGFHEYIRTKGSGAYWPTPSRNTYMLNGEEKKWPEGEYMPDLTEQFVFDFIDRHKQGPFYIHYSLAHIHTDILPTPDSPPSSDDLFSDNVAYMDRLVGRLMAELGRQGLRDKTLVIFTGDNGTYGNEAPRSTIGGRELCGAKAACPLSPRGRAAFQRGRSAMISSGLSTSCPRWPRSPAPMFPTTSRSTARVLRRSCWGSEARLGSGCSSCSGGTGMSAMQAGS
jgi:arylsulfatase A